MKIYIDCVSGNSHLVAMSNKRFADLGGDLVKSENDPMMKVLKELESCYFKGRVSSKCGRSVIELQVLLKNLSKSFKKIKIDNEYFRMKVLESAFKGIYDNCAVGSMGDHYFPKESA